MKRGDTDSRGWRWAGSNFVTPEAFDRQRPAIDARDLARKKYEHEYGKGSWQRLPKPDRKLLVDAARQGISGIMRTAAWSADDESTFQALRSPVVRPDAAFVVSEQKQRKPRGPQLMKLTLTELKYAVRANSWNCAACGNPYGGFIATGEGYIEHAPVQMHVTKTVAESGTKADVIPGCSVANRLHGRGKGLAVVDLQGKVAAAFARRGYRWVRQLIECA